MTKVINKIVYLFILLLKIKWIKIISLYNSDSVNVIWIYQNAPKNFISYIKSNAFLNDAALIHSFIDNNKSFKIIIGSNVGGLSNKKIFYNISKLFNVFGFTNHSSTIIGVIDELEKQNNILFPSLKELKYWENKSYMHRSFDNLKIPSPKTWIVSKPKDIDSIDAEIKYPCLMKECNSSGSLGLHKTGSAKELKDIILKQNSTGKYEFLVQELVNMRKDLRVIFVDGEIVLHYWRINKSDNWRPTSTGHGSNVDFYSFPENWHEEIVSICKKLDIRTGAFDITWENDDLSTKPLILEVSPSYMPNPKIPEKWSNISYSDYKKKITFKNSYVKEYIDIVFNIKLKVVNSYFKNL
jgi:glutathione synthase/RimK-type ligase-like ATP-grasp enzyme